MKRIKSHTVFLIIAAIVVLSWIRTGYFIATGESGLQFYNPGGVSEFYKYTWTEGAIGLPTSYAITSYPLLRFLSLMERLTFTAYSTQAIFFFVMIYLGMAGVFELCKTFFSKEKFNSYLYLVPPFFYTFNLFALVNIWNRLQYTFIIFYSFLPLGLWLYIQGLQKKRYKYAVYLNIAMMPFVVAFSSIPLLELFWLVVFSFTVYFLCLDLQSKRNWFFIVTYFLFSMFSWILCNAWWLLQFIFVLKNSPYVTTQAYTSSGNTEAFSLLSSQLGNLSYVFRLMHREFFINIQPIWAFNFLNPFFILISFLVPFLAFFPLLLKKRPPLINYLLFFALLTIFFTKGDGAPFGFIFFWAFNHLRVLEVFRNPFEKIGIILPLTYAPLIGYSLYRIQEHAKGKHWEKKLRGATLLSIIFFIGVLNFPYWNKLIFNKDYVNVPDFYEQANAYLTQLQKSEDPFRAIAVPMSGEGITYNWGYSGVEVSNGLFTTPFISFSTSIQFYKPITEQVEEIIFNHPNNMYQMMQLLNAKYLLRRSDINFQERKITNPQYIQERIKKGIANINDDRVFDQLHFYKLSDEEYLPRIYASNKVIFTDSDYIFNDILPYAKYDKGTIFLNQQSQDLPKMDIIAAESVIKADLTSNDAVKVNKENALSELPSIRSVPGRWSYFLIRVKEKIEEWSAKPEDKDFLQVNRTSKRLVELDTLIKNKANKELLRHAANEYDKYLNNLNIKWIAQNLLAKEAILRQYYVLQAIPDGTISGIISGLKDKLDHVITITQSYPFDENLYTYKIKTEIGGKYKLILDSSDIANNYAPANLLNVTVDGEQAYIPLDSSQSKIDLGNRVFEKGQHEIKIAKFLPDNLVNGIKETFELSSGKVSYNPRYTINNFNPYARYQVSFDYFLRSGLMPELQFINDTDIINNRTTPAFHQTLPSRDKFYDWQSYSQTISPNTSARSASIAFKLVSWNNCDQFLKKTFFWQDKCQDKQIRNFYTNPSEIIIKNLRVEKVFDSALIAIKENPAHQDNELPNITFTKINPTKYKIRVQNAQSPYILVLSEAFHPLWSAQIGNHKIDSRNHVLANGYANAWNINGPQGDYDVMVSFEAQKFLTSGSIITLVSVLLFITGIFIYKIKRI